MFSSESERESLSLADSYDQGTMNSDMAKDVRRCSQKKDERIEETEGRKLLKCHEK